MQLENAGIDNFGREVYLGFAPSFDDVTKFVPPSAPFVLLLAADTAELSLDYLHALASYLLDLGAVYVMCWGKGAARFEDIIDEAAVVRDLSQNESVIMTTSHMGEKLEEVLHFAANAAQPDQAYLSVCRAMVLLFCSNINWHNEAHNILEDTLRS